MDAWVSQAVTKIEADMQRSSDTHLVPVPLPGFEGIELYLKDESTHPTGSLKHRLARSLFLFALCNGEIKEGSTIIEASSGSTAISEAYFARLLGLPFIAVVPESTSVEKIRQIEFYGGQSHKVKGGDIYSAAEALAQIDTDHSLYQPSQALQGMIGVLENHSDSIRIPTIHALGTRESRPIRKPRWHIDYLRPHAVGPS